MADLSQTRANVNIGSIACKGENFTGGEVMLRGQVAYQATSDSRWYLSGTGVAAAKTAKHCILLSPCDSIGGPFIGLALNSVPVNLGATLAANTWYVVSDTLGAICPSTDLGTGDNLIYIGYTSTSSLLITAFNPTGITL